jgi:hypothetical protein
MIDRRQNVRWNLCYGCLGETVGPVKVKLHQTDGFAVDLLAT